MVKLIGGGALGQGLRAPSGPNTLMPSPATYNGVGEYASGQCQEKLLIHSVSSYFFLRLSHFFRESAGSSSQRA